jgi:hypothetical protein
VTINDLLGQPDSFDIIIASQFDTVLDMAVWPHDVGAIIWHGLSPNVGGPGREYFATTQRRARAVFFVPNRELLRFGQAAAFE